MLFNNYRYDILYLGQIKVSTKTKLNLNPFNAFCFIIEIAD
jgi:hypothetical protein